MWYARLVLVVSVFLFFLPMEGFSHPGGTDADGCHIKKKTSKKHCHEKKDGKKVKASKKAKSSKKVTKKKAVSKKKSESKAKSKAKKKTTSQKKDKPTAKTSKKVKAKKKKNKEIITRNTYNGSRRSHCHDKDSSILQEVTCSLLVWLVNRTSVDEFPERFD